MAVTISGVQPGSLCAKKGIRAGDELVSLNSNRIADVLDYQFYMTETKLRLVVRRPGRGYYALCLHKRQYEDIGLEFETYLMDRQHSCTNHCIFCFVDQMPPGMRESLYFKDDDARLSFLFGNYITLTNLSQAEVDRIIKMRISPINVSVHTTDPELRCRMMGNRFAGERLRYLRQLAGAGITVNCQLVLCPGINDGPALARTLDDLGGLYPGVQSVACVPVGLTRFREGLYPLERYGRETARAVIRQVEEFSGRFFREHGVRLAYVSDEFYLRAGLPLPDEAYYGDFAQLENGVGVTALLRGEFRRLAGRLEADGKARDFSLATGTDAAPLLAELIDEAAQKWHNLKYRIYPIRNDYFGETITVAGLVTATDLIRQLRGKPLGDVLLLPDCMLRHEQDKFLDDLTVADVERELGVPVRVVGTGGEDLLRGILELGTE